MQSFALMRSESCCDSTTSAFHNMRGDDKNKARSQKLIGRARFTLTNQTTTDRVNEYIQQTHEPVSFLYSNQIQRSYLINKLKSSMRDYHTIIVELVLVFFLFSFKCIFVLVQRKLIHISLDCIFFYLSFPLYTHTLSTHFTFNYCFNDVDVDVRHPLRLLRSILHSTENTCSLCFNCH